MMPSTTCPGCGRNRRVKNDGRFVKHDRLVGGDDDTRETCSHSGASAEVAHAEAALRTAEQRARIRHEVVDARVAAREKMIADYDAATASARGLADYCDAEVAKIRAALDTLRGAS